MELDKHKDHRSDLGVPVEHISKTCHVITRHRLGYWRTLECLGGLSRPPLLSREPLVVESRARRHSKALHKTHPKHLCELKIEVTCEVKVRSNVKIRRFDVLGPWGPGIRIIEPDSSNSGKMLSKAWLRCVMSISGILRKLRSRSGHKRPLYVRVVIKLCYTCFMAQFRRRTRNSRLKYHLT